MLITYKVTLAKQLHTAAATVAVDLYTACLAVVHPRASLYAAIPPLVSSDGDSLQDTLLCVLHDKGFLAHAGQADAGARRVRLSDECLIANSAVTALLSGCCALLVGMAYLKISWTIFGDCDSH